MNPSTCGADGRSVVRGATLFVPACSLGDALLDAVDALSGTRRYSLLNAVILPSWETAHKLNKRGNTTLFAY